MILNWNLDLTDQGYMNRVVERAAEVLREAGVTFDQYPTGEMRMDLTACHNHGCRLDLPAMLASPKADLLHDVLGIRKHINRRTGKLDDCGNIIFEPRCAWANHTGAPR